MRLEKYKVKYNPAKTTFFFTSEGPKGRIEKGVYYSKIKHKGYKMLYHLSFGDKLKDSDDIDDQVVTDNKDSEKVLATVANTLIAFSKQHPKAQIFFEGSNTARNRLYRMAISKYFDELSIIFDIYGSFNKKWLPFERKNIDYRAFLIKRKIS
jgi:hypothetical protein